MKEGGFIANNAPEKIYRLAAKLKVRDFVVPGNKVELVIRYREIIQNACGGTSFTLYAPGFITQGGEITEMAEQAGDNWHAIVGSGIYGKKDQREAAKQVTGQILD